MSTISITYPKSLLGILRRPLLPLLIGALLLLLLLLVCAAPASAGDVADTWTKRIDKAPEGVTGPVPVVLYVHGCLGLSSRPDIAQDTETWIQTVTKAGWRFVAPDSWARSGRPNACPPAMGFGSVTKETALAVRALRWEEIAYGMARLAEDPSVDPGRIVIFGFSEGGVAVAGTDPHGARALIIAGWTCHSRFPEGVGITAPTSVAVLALEFDRDPIIGPLNAGRCSDFFAGRDGSREVIVGGSGHVISGATEAQQAVTEYLRGLKVQP